MASSTKEHPRDFAPRKVILTGAALVGLLIVIGGLLLLFQRVAIPPLAARDLRPPPATTPLSEGEFEAGQVREKLNTEAQARLKSYGWVDREKGLAHIPIRRAMELLAARARKGGAP